MHLNSGRQNEWGRDEGHLQNSLFKNIWCDPLIALVTSEASLLKVLASRDSKQKRPSFVINISMTGDMQF